MPSNAVRHGGKLVQHCRPLLRQERTLVDLVGEMLAAVPHHNSASYASVDGERGAHMGSARAGLWVRLFLAIQGLGYRGS